MKDAFVPSDVLFCLHLKSSKKKRTRKALNGETSIVKWPYHMSFFSKSYMCMSEKSICYVYGLLLFFADGDGVCVGGGEGLFSFVL